jgi:hypothetical protein
MAGGAIVQVESHAGWRPLVVVVDRRWGGVSGVPVRPGKRRGGDVVAAEIILNRRTEVGDGRRSGTTRWVRAERGGEIEGVPIDQQTAPSRTGEGEGG